MADTATPNLPSRDLGATSDFYGRLGFAETYRDEGWMILRRGEVVLEFFPFPDLDPAQSSFGSCLRLDDVDAFYRVCLDIGLPETTTGFPRLHPPRREESGLRIGALIDPDGTLLRLIEDPGPTGNAGDGAAVHGSAGSEPVPHPPSSQDVAVLIGLMALLEGEHLAGSMDDRIMRRIGDRLLREGLLAASFDTDDVARALNAMNHRLRHACGEDDGSST